MSIQLVPNFPYTTEDYKTKSNEESAFLMSQGADFDKYIMRSFISLIWRNPTGLAAQEAADSLEGRQVGHSLATFTYLRRKIQGLVESKILVMYPGKQVENLTEGELDALLDAALPEDCRPVTECVPYAGAQGFGIVVTTLPWKLTRTVEMQADVNAAIAYGATLV